MAPPNPCGDCMPVKSHKIGCFRNNDNKNGWSCHPFATTIYKEVATFSNISTDSFFIISVL